VVWHDDKRAEIHIGKVLWNLAPAVLRKLPEFEEAHLAFHNLTEEIGAPLGYDGHEIRTRTAVVVRWESD
jgi:hypothetical protein